MRIPAITRRLLEVGVAFVILVGVPVALVNFWPTPKPPTVERQVAQQLAHDKRYCEAQAERDELTYDRCMVAKGWQTEAEVDERNCRAATVLDKNQSYEECMVTPKK